MPPSSHNNSHYRIHDAGKAKERERIDDRHRRLEDERRKHEEKKRELAAAKETNRLHRETPFICHVRFKNDLPEIPSDPKLLVAQVEPEKLSEFFLTEFEVEPKRDLALPQDLGIPLSLLDVERYQIPDVKPPLDPADLALLGEDEERVIGLAATSGARVKPRMRNTELSWLLKTTYISNEAETVRGTGMSEKSAKALSQGISEATTLEEQISLIEATFEAAKKPPKHLKNPSLTPLQVLPVLPDFDNWANKYVTATFDNNPCEEVPALSRLPENIREQKAARCMLKGFKLDSRDNNPQQTEEKFMALIVPKSVPKDLGKIPQNRDVEADEGEYVWCKEYAYSIKTANVEDDPNQVYVLRFRDDSVTYCHLYARLELKKKKKEIDFPRPSKVTLKRRGLNSAEIAEKESKLRKLYGEEEEEQGGWEDEDA